jgi:hypothetical protein
MAAISVWDGTDEVEVTASVWNGVEHPATIDIIPEGYFSVNAMLAEDHFYIAHRGGSDERPEHSLNAYTQAVAWGFGALELALARTSDGVWFGLHDADLNRTSGLVTGTLPPASSMTWAEVQSYQIKPPAGHSSLPSKPYMRFEEYLETYAESHVTFLDLKVAYTFRNEILDIIDVNGGPSRWVAKDYGKAPTQFATHARARGYKTWGYFYADDFASLSTWSSYWDILGLQYDAPTADWTGFVATGKPVVAHICPTQAVVTAAFAKGAKGAMVSGTDKVTPT